MGGKPARRSASVVPSFVVGGILGFTLGILGVVILFLLIPGAPGLAEILILLLGVIFFFVVPGAVIGAVVGFALNSRSSGKR